MHYVLLELNRCPIPVDIFRRLMERLEDVKLAKLVLARANERKVTVAISDL